MLKFSKAGVLLAVVAFCGLLASSASAVTWDTNGPLTASSTNAGASRLIIHPHSGAASVAIGCTTSSGHVNVNGPTSTAVPWTNAATVTPIFSGCTTAGGAGFTVSCNPAELRADTYSGGHTFAAAAGGITNGAVTGVDCRLSIGVTPCVTVTGSVSGHYTNGSPSASGAGRLLVTTAGQSLTTTNIGAGCAAIPSGRATFGTAASGSSIANLQYTVDGPNSPVIFQT